MPSTVQNRTGVWPEDLLKSILVRIEKRPQTTRLDGNRTISLVVHASKVLLHVPTNRIEHKARDLLEESNSVFVEEFVQEKL